MKAKILSATLITLATTALVGCGDKSDFEKAINEKISKNGVCFGFNQGQNAKAADDFRLGIPVKLNLSSNSPILDGLKNAGYLDISYEQDFFNRVAVLTSTEKGRNTPFWDSNKGACVGHRVVDEVTSWTEPADNGGQKVTQVAYTWKLSDMPGWVDKKAFAEAGIEGIEQAQPGKMILVKTNNGWQASGF